MNTTLLISALALISVLTSLTVEAIKKIRQAKQKDYNSTLLAVIVALVLTIAGSILYAIFYSIPITPQGIVSVIALAYLSFLSATCGFDQVKNILEKIGGAHGE